MVSWRRVCGIYGAIDLRDRRTFPPDRLAAMGAALAHRGPDGAGEHVEPGVALGARRLALVDPAAGHQPVVGERFVAAVNGELFDHAAERARLERRGARFRTRCDSEVWIHAFADAGEAYLATAAGQFALALWDRRERRLVLARDRFGICPLYTAEADGWLLFASEIKALLATGLVAAALDPRGIDHVFACLCASPVRSAFAGVSPLPPGHRLAARVGEPVHLARFAAAVDFPDRGCERRAPTPRALAALADELSHALAGAVDRRLAADAPVAVYLSGGVDSSLLVALAARGGRPVTAFSVALAGTLGPDESALAAATARSHGASHTTVRVAPAEITSLFPEVVRAAEVPVLDHADAALLALARAVRARGFRAVLTGEGADEAFAGYPWTRLLHRRGALTAAARAFGLVLGGGASRLAPATAFGATGAGRLAQLFSRVRAQLYAPAFFERLGGWTPADDHAWDERRLARWDPLHRSLYADYECVLAGHLLADKGDRVAMAAGVEPRFPFLDEAVVALAASLAPSLKLGRGRDKLLLREVAARHLPPAAAHRRKLMFRAEPIIHGPGRPRWVDELLSPPSLARTGLFDPARVAAALAARDRPWSPRRSLLQGGLTAVVSTQLLAHLYCGGGLCSI
jgi:asparagine synthase (glutamine-hydrolysing)